MAHTAASEPSAPNQPSSVDRQKNPTGSSNPSTIPTPKLTMKFLYEKISELQQENERLAQHIEELERQWSEFGSAKVESAAAMEDELTTQHPETALAVLEDNIREEPQEEGRLDLVRLSYRYEIVQDNLLPRSERHPKKLKKKPFLFQFLNLLLPFRTS